MWRTINTQLWIHTGKCDHSFRKKNTVYLISLSKWPPHHLGHWASSLGTESSLEGSSTWRIWEAPLPRMIYVAYTLITLPWSINSECRSLTPVLLTEQGTGSILQELHNCSMQPKPITQCVEGCGEVKPTDHRISLQRCKKRRKKNHVKRKTILCKLCTENPL